MERLQGAADDDESGRVARFRRRFGGSEPSSSKAQSPRAEFDEQDLGWMSVGGREAKAGSALPTRKPAKGKGKK